MCPSPSALEHHLAPPLPTALSSHCETCSQESAWLCCCDELWNWDHRRPSDCLTLKLASLSSSGLKYCCWKPSPGKSFNCSSHFAPTHVANAVSHACLTRWGSFARTQMRGLGSSTNWAAKRSLTMKHGVKQCMNASVSGDLPVTILLSTVGAVVLQLSEWLSSLGAGVVVDELFQLLVDFLVGCLDDMFVLLLLWVLVGVESGGCHGVRQTVTQEDALLASYELLGFLAIHKAGASGHVGIEGDEGGVCVSLILWLFPSAWLFLVAGLSVAAAGIGATEKEFLLLDWGDPWGEIIAEDSNSSTLYLLLKFLYVCTILSIL